MPSTTTSETRVGQPQFDRALPVGEGEEAADGGVGEVEDAGGGVGDDQAAGEDGVDAAEGDADDEERA